MMVKINGRIVMIIPPEDHGQYLLPFSPHKKDSPFHGFYFLKVTTSEIPVKTYVRDLVGFHEGLPLQRRR
jgi:hypothetical protein